MQKNVSIRLLPSEAEDANILRTSIAMAAGCNAGEITGYYFTKRSIDARSKTAWINLSCRVFINEPFFSRPLPDFVFKDVSGSKHKVIIAGSGPAGLFAALKLVQHGIKPIIIERGKDTRSRRRDLASLNKDGILNPESNYCFGEGGAGTYSDGKLYTRSTKRGDVYRILQLFVHFGANENILFEAHPHIGTNKLPAIITAIRNRLVECGAEYYFNSKIIDLDIQSDHVSGVYLENKELIKADAVILSTGHSARNIFNLLHHKKITIEFKPFALGVRIEHPQSLIDSLQYHCKNRGPLLPPSAYNLVHQVNGKGVFSFCMCPGGIIAPASTEPGSIVVNGWSPSKRNNPFANSGIVVSVEEEDVTEFRKYNSLAGMHFQRSIEEKAFEFGGGKFVAPAQRLVDFIYNKTSSTLPDCSYLPGVHSAPLNNVLPPFIHKRLQQAFKAFDQKMKGYLTNEAIVVATESRTSSPIRIPRDHSSLEHIQIKKLYPCGEGAGYAGGIVSAAMDGERVAEKITASLGIQSPYVEEKAF